MLASYAQFSGKAQQIGMWLLCRFKLSFSQLIRVSRDLESSFSSWSSKTDTFTNGDFPN